MSGGWKKWECPPDMLTVEEKLKTLQLWSKTDKLQIKTKSKPKKNKSKRNNN